MLRETNWLNLVRLRLIRFLLVTKFIEIFFFWNLNAGKYRFWNEGFIFLFFTQVVFILLIQASNSIRSCIRHPYFVALVSSYYIGHKISGLHWDGPHYDDFDQGVHYYADYSHFSHVLEVQVFLENLQD